MIRFVISIASPFAGGFRSLLQLGSNLTKNNAWGLEVYWAPSTLLEVEMEARPRRASHGGLYLSVGVLGLFVSAKIYDTRPWTG